MTAHAKLAPSSAARWLACPASATAAQQVVTPDTEHSIAGTARHWVAAEWLTRGAPPAVGTQVPGLTGVVVTEEMLADARPGVEWVIAYKATSLFVEERTTIAPVFGLPAEELFGTVDVLGLKADELLILDHKFGYQKVVVDENPQLMLYALGVMEEMGWLWPRLRLVINQPRGDGITEWVVTKESLLAWREKVAPSVARAAAGTPEYVPGEEQCRYCPAAGVCKALQTQTLALAQAEFSIADRLEHITLEELSVILQRADLIEASLKAAKEHALKLALAGTEVPGYKVVESNKHRQWTNEKAAVEVFTTLGFNPDDFAPRKMLSPAAADKILGKEVVAKYAAKPRGEPVLAPEADKRPVYKPFDDISDVAKMLE